jgi:hypothetical protein
MLGLSPGLLYSALTTIMPDRLVVLTSEQGERSLDEILRRAEFHGNTAVVRVGDPFTCFHEAGEKIAEVASIARNDCEWVINLTGGTTALQYIIQRSGAKLESSGYEVSYVALVDRRGSVAQHENPWVIGELIEVG